MNRAALLACGFLFLLAAAFPAASRAATPEPATTPASASPPDVTDLPERKQALELYDQFKMAQAYPLLQKLVDAHPRDALLLERCGVALVSYTSTLTDPAQRKAAIVKARAMLVKAQSLGDDSNLCKTMISMLPADGGEKSFSSRKGADDAMQQAEADFARGDFDKALDGYQRALVLDPGLYEAALFSGDVRFKQNKNDLAIEWYERAVRINPDAGVGYRYWGDSLMAEGKMDEARVKFMQAVAAEPYDRSTWTGLAQWADKNNVTLTPLQLQDRGGAVESGTDGSTNIVIGTDAFKGDAASAAWLGYTTTRALWRGGKFKKTFPAETAYRHSLAEEAEALHTLVGVIDSSAQKAAAGNADGKKDDAIPDDLARLVKVDKAGLLEACILLERADEGIAQDFPAYRKAHRDLLLRYLDEFVVPKAPK